MHELLFYTHVSAIFLTAPNQDKRNVILGSCSSCTQIRLAGGCSGTLEVLTENHGWGTATDRNFGVNEGTVVCRQLGCDTSTVTRSNTREYVYSNFKLSSKHGLLLCMFLFLQLC